MQQVSSLGLLRHKLRSCLFRRATDPCCQRLHCALWGVQPLFIGLFCWPGAHTVLCSHCFAAPMTGCRVNQTVTSDSLIHQFYSYLFVVFGWYDQAPQSRCCEPCVLLQSYKFLPGPGDTGNPAATPLSWPHPSNGSTVGDTEFQNSGSLDCFEHQQA